MNSSDIPYYTTVELLFADYAIIYKPKKHSQWRLVPNRPTGTITSVGLAAVLLATDGVHGYAATTLDYLFEFHMDNWLEDQAPRKVSVRKPKAMKEQLPPRSLAELFQAIKVKGAISTSV